MFQVISEVGGKPGKDRTMENWKRQNIKKRKSAAWKADSRAKRKKGHYF